MNGCCIVETRPIPGLSQIIKDHLRFIPEDWGLTIYCSINNQHLLEDYDRDTNVFLLDEHFTINDYNLLFKSVEFWDSLPYEKVLIFQCDSMLLRDGIEEFLEFDYVGAPWKFMEYGGNGGLSLRSVKLMKDICEHFSFTPRNEDVLFCQIMKKHNIGKLAPRDVCMKFSVETIFTTGTLGYHAIDNWLPKEQCYVIKNQYG